MDSDIEEIDHDWPKYFLKVNLIDEFSSFSSSSSLSHNR